MVDTPSSTASAVWNPSRESHQVIGSLEEQRSEQVDTGGTLIRNRNGNTSGTLLEGDWLSPDVNSSLNMFSEETEESKSASAWSIFSNCSAPNSGKRSNSRISCLNDGRKLDASATCRLFGIDLNSPLMGAALLEKSSLKSVDKLNDASEGCVSNQRQQLQVPVKEVPSRQNHSTRSRTKV